MVFTRKSGGTFHVWFLKGLKIKVGRIWFWNVTHEWFAHQRGAGKREPHCPYVGVFQTPEPAWFRWNHSEISSVKNHPCWSDLKKPTQKEVSLVILATKTKGIGETHIFSLISIQVWKIKKGQNMWHQSLKVNVSWWFKHVKMGRNFPEKKHVEDMVAGRNPANHLQSMKPYERWDILRINWCRISSNNSIMMGRL